MKALAARVSPPPADTFRHYVVDRFRAPGGGEEFIYLRLKVPFDA